MAVLSLGEKKKSKMAKPYLDIALKPEVENALLRQDEETKEGKTLPRQRVETRNRKIPLG